MELQSGRAFCKETDARGALKGLENFNKVGNKPLSAVTKT